MRQQLPQSKKASTRCPVALFLVGSSSTRFRGGSSARLPTQNAMAVNSNCSSSSAEGCVQKTGCENCVKHDISIIGAGPAGLSFARSLANTDLKVVVLEKLPRAALSDPAFDGRDIALTHKSVKTLRELGVWSRIHTGAIYPIREARVLDGASPYFLSFGSKKDSVEALGYIVSNHIIRKALYEEVDTVANVEIITDAAVTSPSLKFRASANVRSEIQYQAGISLNCLNEEGVEIYGVA